MNYERLADIVREEIKSDYVPNSCILAARLTTIVLRRFGIMSEAMAVELEAFSPAYVEMMLRMSELGRDLTDDEVGEFAKRGAWRVGLDFGPAPEGVQDNRGSGGYNGHVVTLVEDRRWMIDPTLAQVARPHKGLEIEAPYAWEIDYEHAAADGGLVLRTSNGTHVIYRFLPERRDYRKAPDWRLSGFREELFNDTLGRVVGRLLKEERATHH